MYLLLIRVFLKLFMIFIFMLNKIINLLLRIAIKYTRRNNLCFLSIYFCFLMSNIDEILKSFLFGTWIFNEIRRIIF